MTTTPYSLPMKVRDYECDMQGIVNNAVYQHYLEHARHEYLSSRGLNFAELTAAGVIIVMVRAEIDYRGALRAGDEFKVTVVPSRPSPVRLVFDQAIQRRGMTLLEARIVTTAVNERGRPYFPEVLEKLL